MDVRNLPMIILLTVSRWAVARFAVRPAETGKVVDF